MAGSVSIPVPQQSDALRWQLEHLYSVRGVSLEFRFHATRKWRLDLAIESARVGVEIQGGIFAATRGKHSRGVGQVRDMEKNNAAIECGWVVLVYPTDAIKNGSAAEQIARVYAQRLCVDLEALKPAKKTEKTSVLSPAQKTIRPPLPPLAPYSGPPFVATGRELLASSTLARVRK